jgi:pilus assembly protein CpaB
MERKKLMLAGALGVAAIGLFFVLESRNAPAPQATPMATAPVVEQIEHEFVLVAISDVQRGQRITPEMLDWQQWPAEAVAPSFIVRESRPQAIDELTESVVRMDIFTGEPVNEAKLVRAGDSGLMAALLAPGMRAITTRVSTDSAAGGFIMPGDKVDIVLTKQLPRDPNQSQATNVTMYTAGTIFEDVKVLAMNQNYTTGPESPAALDSVSFATFELSPSDAEVLEAAAETGTISLMLRGLQPNGVARNAATFEIEEVPESSSVVVYRNGQQTQTAIQGR